MASIFLSYARDDAARAARVADAFEGAGHSVWWDRQIGAGSRFSKEIERALDSADLIVVLWSKKSVDSDWVRDEAAIGRDSGRLVPALLDKVQPPLGFRQYQSVRVDGRAAPTALIDAVAARINGRASPAPLPQRLFRARIAALVALLLFAAAGAAYWLLGRGPAAETMVVGPGDDSRESELLARGVSRDLGQFRSGPLATLTIFDSGDPGSKRATYRLVIGASGTSGAFQADLALKQAGGLLWSGIVENGASPGDLRQQASGLVGAVLNCLAELDDWRDRTDARGIALYLKGCAETRQDAVLPVYRQLVAAHPKFAPGWANLAMTAALESQTVGTVESAALRQESRRAIAQAEKLAPDYPETAIAKAEMLPPGGAQAEREIAMLDRSLVARPEHPLLHAARSHALMYLGRVGEATKAAETAWTLNPLSAATFDNYVGQLAYGGKVEQALAKLAEADRRWPGSPQISDLRYRLNLRFGDPAAAKAHLSRDHDSRSQIADRVWLAFLEARIDPSPTNIDRALVGFRQQYERDHRFVIGFLQALVTFGRVDEAFAILADRSALGALAIGADTLFRPYMAPLRNDPRFFVIAKQIGLVDAWQRSGIWPDFCKEPGFPYDCRAQAARVVGIKPLSP